jgi:hypothetical protein
MGRRVPPDQGRSINRFSAGRSVGEGQPHAPGPHDTRVEVSGQRPPLSFRYLSSSESVERMSQVFSSRLLFNVSIVFQNW